MSYKFTIRNNKALRRRAAVCQILAGLALCGTAAAQSPVKPEGDFYAKRQATIQCVVEAAHKQRVPANVLLAIASVEAGRNGQTVENVNGSFDLGHFQINTIHFGPRGQFRKYPITIEDVRWRGCYNAELAAWMLRQHIEEPGNGQDYWTRVANYHSRTPEFNARYRGKLIPYAVKWGEWLQAAYVGQVEVGVKPVGAR